MSEGITINLGDAVPYVVEEIRRLIGKDAASREWQIRLSELVKLSAQQASMVQCVGMSQPIPITDIYQRTSIRVPARGRSYSFESLIEAGKDAVVFAGPGWGKTTLLHWMYIQLLEEKRYVPLLFTLRWPSAVDDLRDLVTEIMRGRSVGQNKDRRVVILVDGYDEIKEAERQKVSQALMLFSSLSIGNYYLTCRSHYHVYDLKCQHLELGPFSRTDAERFIAAYSRAYGSEVDAAGLLQELDEHHLGEFWTHPLMLTLVCILKSGPSQQIPRRAIGLLRRAIDTLTFRWDEAKRVDRSPSIPLDCEEHLRCLMRIAFEMDSPQESWETVQRAASAHLGLLQMKHVNVRVLLEEMARFYGLLVPADEGSWQFTHRTFHDYLSARYWVESGNFNPADVREWDVHAAYAACLTADATEAMTRMVQGGQNLLALRECLYNSAPFDAGVIANAIITRIRDALRFDRDGYFLRISGEAMLVSGADDVFSVCTDEYLRILFKTAVRLGETQHPYNQDEIVAATSIVALCSIGELFTRGAKIRPKYVEELARFVGPQMKRFVCSIGDRDVQFSLSDLKAATG
jgi:hypothetical protein